MNQPSNGSARAFAYLALFTEIGIALFVTTMGGALLGNWLDQQISTSPLFVVTGFLAGALAGAVVNYRLVTRFLARLENE